ncbi:DUF5994 family protein [Streptomyces sp. NPDC003631]
MPSASCQEPQDHRAPTPASLPPRPPPAADAPHTVVLLSAGRGRWDLVVVPRYTTEDAAKPLMAAAAGDLGAG